jgi:hypothetical protein
MSNLFNKTKHFGKNEVLLVGDHFTSIGAFHAQANAGNPGLATLLDGRYVVKAGTIYPSNDANAVGVVANDYDVTDTDVNMAIITHGIIKTAALPAHASSDAKAAMPLLSFYPPSSASNVTRWLALITPAYIGEGDAALAEEVKVELELAAGATFISAAAAENVSNWTVTGGSTTKLEVKAIELLADNKVELELDIQSAQNAAVGTLSVRPSHAIISNGQAPDAMVVAEVPAFWASVTALAIAADLESMDNQNITLVINDPEATFASEVAAETAGNWTVTGTDTTDLEVKSITYVDEKTVTIAVGLETSGKTVAGTLSITPKDAALTGEAALVAINLAVVS